MLSMLAWLHRLASDVSDAGMTTGRKRFPYLTYLYTTTFIELSIFYT